MSHKLHNDIPEQLWAKSFHSQRDTYLPQFTLFEHSRIVAESSQYVVDLYGPCVFRALGLPLEILETFKYDVRLAAGLHDIGKANRSFQNILTQSKSQHAKQQIRHEVLSLFIIYKNKEIRQWLLQQVDGDIRRFNNICAAISGHHRKFPSQAFFQNDVNIDEELYIKHPQIQQLIFYLSRDKTNIPNLDQCETHLRIPFFKFPTLISQWFLDLEHYFNSETFVSDQLYGEKYLAAMKSFVMFSDLFGSLKDDEKRTHFNEIVQELQNRQSSKFLQRFAHHYQQLIQKTQKQYPLRQFQVEASHSTAPITLILAGCGSGKTFAAYKWFEQYLQHQHIYRLMFCYPTTHTAFEGFRYVHTLSQTSHDMLHMDLETSRRNIDLCLSDLDTNVNEDEMSEKYEAFRLLFKHTIVCTTDTVLGIMQNHKKSIYNMATICSSAIVFDEIHSYDDELFNNLLSFLECFCHIPVLLMTASLPQHRLVQLHALSQKIHSQPLTVIRGPQELEDLVRYKIHIIKKQKHKSVISNFASDILPIIDNAVKQQQKILYICNTVESCQHTYFYLSHNFPNVARYAYHSRFKYEDRVARHNQIMQAFSTPEKPCIVISTQVCEMSLNISADILISEIAPIPSLIQRLGRLNRFADASSIPKPAYMLSWYGTNDNNAYSPYTKNDIDLAQQWVSKLLDIKYVSQRDLQTEWNKILKNKKHIVNNSSSYFSNFLNGGFSTETKEIRDDSVTFPIILESDLISFSKTSMIDDQNIQRYVIPMTLKTSAKKLLLFSKKLFGIFVIKDDYITYSLEVGASWKD